MIVKALKIDKPSEKLEFHEWTHDDIFESKDIFVKFLNWTSGEFTLDLQDDSEGLIVYFPNGYFSIKEIGSIKNHIEFKIKIKSKCFKKGTKIFNQVISILNHLQHFKKEHE
ncbi:MAG: hypothetical protein ABJK28_17390 [Algibacter sp.]